MSTSRFKRYAGFATIALAASLGTLLALRARAAGIPDAAALTYTGYLENPDGTPVIGTKGIGISVYDAESDGNEVCAVKPADVEPVAGRFQLTLPEKCTAAVKANPDLWIEVQVEGSLLGRTRLGAVPYAVEAQNAQRAAAADEATHAATAEDASKDGPLDQRLAAIEAVVTPWIKITPAPTMADGTGPVTPQAIAGHYRRVGDSAQITIKTSFTTSTTAASGYFLWKLPAALKMDNTKLEAGYTTVGSAQVSFGGDYATCSVNAAGGTLAIDCNGPGASVKSVPASSTITMHLTIPIEGWGAL